MQPSDLMADFRARFTDPESSKYLETHVRRYEILLGTVARLAAGHSPFRILDVGPAYQTDAMRAAIPDAVVDTLGWADSRFPLRDGEQHIEFDLNSAGADSPPQLGEHDLVVAAEVIEHLYTAPVHVLRYLASGLVPGGRLLIQTPNAASLFKRLKLLRGRNPFEPIRENRSHPGHFREYTLAELLALGPEAGLEVEESSTANYFDHGSRKHRLFVAAAPVLPARFRDGLTVVYRKR